MLKIYLPKETYISPTILLKTQVSGHCLLQKCPINKFQCWRSSMGNTNTCRIPNALGPSSLVMCRSQYEIQYMYQHLPKKFWWRSLQQVFHKFDAYFLYNLCILTRIVVKNYKSLTFNFKVNDTRRLLGNLRWLNTIFLVFRTSCFTWA